MLRCSAAQTKQTSDLSFSISLAPRLQSTLVSKSKPRLLASLVRFKSRTIVIGRILPLDWSVCNRLHRRCMAVQIHVRQSRWLLEAVLQLPIISSHRMRKDVLRSE